MIFTKKREIGRKIEEIQVGEKLSVTEKIEDKDLLLYLGLTNDSNPLYIQHDYVSQTPYKKPIVPSILLTGIISSAVSKYFPGPGSHILKQEIEFLKPVYHYEAVQFMLEVVEVNYENHSVVIKVTGENESGQLVMKGSMNISPPLKQAEFKANLLENF